MNQIDELSQATHTFYRLSNTATSLKFLLLGVLKVFNNYLSFSSSKIILKNANGYQIILARLKGGRVYIFKKGGMRVLKGAERRLVKAMKEKYSVRTASIPMVFGDSTGIFIGERDAAQEYSDEDRKKLKMFVEGAGLLLHNYLLCEEQQRVIVGSIKALSRFLSHSIPTSSIHGQIMNRLIKDLARELNLTKSETGSLEYAAMLHDAGKVNVPVNILSKEAPLTEDEYLLIKSHPKQGVALVRDLHMLKPVLPIILYHHERYDGTGYPSGLKKKQIPMGARILAVIDAFDAMIFGRPYKKKISLEEATQEFRKNRGVQFDPDIVDAFLRVLVRHAVRKYLKRIA